MDHMGSQLSGKKFVAAYRNVLDFLNETSNDYYFFFDFFNETLYFSDKILGTASFLPKDRSFCTFEEWKSIVYPKDIPILMAEFEGMKAGKYFTHNLEYRITNIKGEMAWIHSRGKSQLDEDGVPKWMIGRISESTLPNQADRFTGTFNMDSLKHELEQLLSNHQSGYLLLLGVDDLKAINIQKGWESGNEILKLVARDIEDATSGKKVYRVNGDCFAVNIPGVGHEEVELIFSNLQRSLQGQCTLSGGCVSLDKFTVPDAETLFQYAEKSMDLAKERGKNRLCTFSVEDYEKNLAELELKEDLYNSVRSGYQGFSVVYQPQLYTNSLQLYGAEALLRFHSPRSGPVEPSRFIPALEETGLMVAVGMWVLQTALEQCKKWQKIIPNFHISVNISQTQLEKRDIVTDIISCLNRVGVAPACLTLEVKENILLSCASLLNETCVACKNAGFRISVDDFGTGHSSLTRLKELKINEIKIDQCIIHEIQNSVYNHRLISNVIELAKSRDIEVCCEAVESLGELVVLRELKPTRVQGYLFAKPCPVQQFEALYLDDKNIQYQQRAEQEQKYLHSAMEHEQSSSIEWKEDELAQAVLSAESDIFYVSDLETYDLYYLNLAGRKALDVKGDDYVGKKCYRVLQGLNEPCEFCTNHLLNEDDFYIWEWQNTYSGRRYLLKDKLITYHGKKVRLEVAADITNRENTSKSVKERLKFAEKVVDYTNILSNTVDYKEAVNDVLKSLGEFHQADRAYMFEPSVSRDYWTNTFEWCGENVTPQYDQLQEVPISVVQPWLDAFQRNRSIYIYNLDTLQKTSPALWEVLSMQDISRLIVAPVRDGSEIIAFIGVDNPRYAIDDDSQLRVLSNFLLDRIRHERSELHLRTLLRTNYHSILDILNVGLWVIRLDKNHQHNEMIADDTFKRILGLSSSLPPEECYRHWYERVSSGYYNYVNDAVQQMIDSWSIVQLEYTWVHPQDGEVMVRCIGVRVPDEDGMICLKGYHRIISDIEQPKVVADTALKMVFEYNELNHTAFFHVGRNLLVGDNVKEVNFPQSWIDAGIIHPHFASEFLHAFSMLRMKQQARELEMLLKARSGSYEWFKITLLHPSKEEKDLDTVIVTAEPCGVYRRLEMEHRRIQQFYRVLLSETVAFAEVDLESGNLKSIGGIWSCYEQEMPKGNGKFINYMLGKFEEYLSEEKIKRIRDFCSAENWNEMFERGDVCQRFTYQRMINGHLRWVELAFHLFRENSTQNVYGLLYLKDIHSQKEREMLQLEAATLDPLTRVLNRSAFKKEVCQYVSTCSADICGALILMDVDNFKNINDQMGHLMGDKALKDFAYIIRSTFRQTDIVGRLGGDEFLVFVKGGWRVEDLNRRMEQILKKFRENPEPPMTSSIGITFVQKNQFDYKEWLRQADVALYQTKKNGKNGFCYYSQVV